MIATPVIAEVIACGQEKEMELQRLTALLEGSARMAQRTNPCWSCWDTGAAAEQQHQKGAPAHGLLEDG